MPKQRGLIWGLKRGLKIKVHFTQKMYTQEELSTSENEPYIIKRATIFKAGSLKRADELVREAIDN